MLDFDLVFIPGVWVCTVGLCFGQLDGKVLSWKELLWVNEEEELIRSEPDEGLLGLLNIYNGIDWRAIYCGWYACGKKRSRNSLIMRDDCRLTRIGGPFAKRKGKFIEDNISTYIKFSIWTQNTFILCDYDYILWMCIQWT